MISVMPRKRPTKPFECMTASELNRSLDKIDAATEKLNDAFITAGRGHERPTETSQKADILAERAKAIWDLHHRARSEVVHRMGYSAHRLPEGRGFGPLSTNRERCRRWRKQR